MKPKKPLPLSETILWDFSLEKDIKYEETIATLDGLFDKYEVEEILKNSAKALLQQSGGKAKSANFTKEKWFGLPNPICTLTCAAHMKGLEETLAYARENNLDINQPIGKCGGPLHYAAIAKQPGPVKCLIEAGASLSMENGDGNNPFMTALVQRSKRCAEIIWPYNKHFSLLTQNEKGYTALHLAALGDAGEFVERLMKCMERVDQSDDDGNNALLLAAAKSNMETFQAFWKFRKHIGLMDINNMENNALHVAALRKWTDGLTLIISDPEFGLDEDNNALNTALHISCAAGDMKSVELLVTEGSQIINYNRRSYSPICEAIMAGHRDVVEFLLCNLTEQEMEDYTDRLICMILDEEQLEQAKLAKKDDALNLIIYHLYCSRYSRPVMIDAALFRPWLEEIAHRHCEDPDKLGTWLGYVTHILCTKKWEKRMQRSLTRQFVECRCPEYLLRLMNHFSSVGSHLAASYFILPLLCFGQNDVGNTWLARNYHNILTFISHFDAHRCTFKCIPELANTFGSLWSDFKQKVHNTQARESERHANELLAMVESEKEKERKKAKKKAKGKKKNEAKLENEACVQEKHNEPDTVTTAAIEKATDSNTSEGTKKNFKERSGIGETVDMKTSNIHAAQGNIKMPELRSTTQADHLIVIDESWDVAFQITKNDESPASGEWMTIGKKQTKGPAKKVNNLEKTGRKASVSQKTDLGHGPTAVEKPANKVTEKTKPGRGEIKADLDTNWRTGERLCASKDSTTLPPPSGNKWNFPTVTGNADSSNWRKGVTKQEKPSQTSKIDNKKSEGNRQAHQKVKQNQINATKVTTVTQCSNDTLDNAAVNENCSNSSKNSGNPCRLKNKTLGSTTACLKIENDNNTKGICVIRDTGNNKKATKLQSAANGCGIFKKGYKNINIESGRKESSDICTNSIQSVSVVDEHNTAEKDKGESATQCDLLKVQHRRKEKGRAISNNMVKFEMSKNNDSKDIGATEIASNHIKVKVDVNKNVKDDYTTLEEADSQVTLPSQRISNGSCLSNKMLSQSNTPYLNSEVTSPYVPIWAGVFNTPVTSSMEVLEETAVVGYDNINPREGKESSINQNKTVVSDTGTGTRNSTSHIQKDKTSKVACDNKTTACSGTGNKEQQLSLDISVKNYSSDYPANFTVCNEIDNNKPQPQCHYDGSVGSSLGKETTCTGNRFSNQEARCSRFAGAEIQFMHGSTPETSKSEDENLCPVTNDQSIHISDISFMSDSMLSSMDDTEDQAVVTDQNVQDEPSLSDLSWLARGMLNWNSEPLSQLVTQLDITHNDHTDKLEASSDQFQNADVENHGDIFVKNADDKTCSEKCVLSKLILPHHPQKNDTVLPAHPTDHNEYVNQCSQDSCLQNQCHKALSLHHDAQMRSVSESTEVKDRRPKAKAFVNTGVASALDSKIKAKVFVDKIVANALTKLHTVAEENDDSLHGDEYQCDLDREHSMTDVSSSNTTCASLTQENSSANDADISDNDAEVMFYTSQNQENGGCQVYKPQPPVVHTKNPVDVMIRTSSPTMSGNTVHKMNSSLNVSPIPEAEPPKLDGTAVVGICRPIVYHPDSRVVLSSTGHNGTGDGLPPTTVQHPMHPVTIGVRDSEEIKGHIDGTDNIIDKTKLNLDAKYLVSYPSLPIINGEGDGDVSDLSIDVKMEAQTTSIVSPLRKNLEILTSKKLNESSFAELSPDEDVWLDKQPDNYLPGLRYINKKWIDDGLFAIRENPVKAVIEKQWRYAGHDKVIDHIGGSEYVDLHLYHVTSEGQVCHQKVSPCKIDCRKGRSLLPLHLLSDGESDKERSGEAVEVSFTSFISNDGDISSVYVPWSTGSNPDECSAEEILVLEEVVSPTYAPWSGVKDAIASSAEKTVEAQKEPMKNKPVALVLPTSDPSNTETRAHVESSQTDDWPMGQQIPTIITARHERFTEQNNLDTADHAEDARRNRPDNFGSEALYVNRLSNVWGRKMTDFIALHYTNRRHIGQLNFSTAPQFAMATSSFRDTLMVGCHDNGMELAIKRTTLTVARTMLGLIEDLPEVVRVHDRLLPYTAVYEDLHYGYLAMPLCEHNLRYHIHDLKSRHQLSLALQRPLVAQMLEGLGFLHQHGVVHGRLSPSNLLVDIEGGVRLADFGTTMKHKYRLMPRDEVKRYWRSSEVAVTGDVEAGKMSDIQVAGMLFYYIMTGGEHPCGRSPAEAQVNITRGWPKPREISIDVDSVLDTMLAFVPRARPSAEEVLSSIFFWDDQKRYEFLVGVAKVYLRKPNNYKINQDLINRINAIRLPELRQGKTWLDVVDRYILREMTSQGRLYTPHLTNLIQFMENTVAYQGVMSASSRQLLRDPAAFYLGRFPSLPSLVYQKLTKAELSKIFR